MTDTIDFIKRFEGFSPTPYKCPAGYFTFGYGSLVSHYPDTKFPVSEEDASTYLDAALMSAERAVRRLINVDLTENQFSALCSFVYNVGSGSLQRSTLRRKVNREEHCEVPEEFMKWVFGGGRKLPGLIARRKAEGELYALV